MQNVETLLRTLIGSEVRVYLRIILHCVSMTVLLFTVSCDWEHLKCCRRKQFVET